MSEEMYGIFEELEMPQLSCQLDIKQEKTGVKMLLSICNGEALREALHTLSCPCLGMCVSRARLSPANLLLDSGTSCVLLCV